MAQNDVRLVFLAPRTGSNGPAYYADQLLAHVRHRVTEVVEVRHGPAGEDTWADVRRTRALVREAVGDGARTVLHAELSGGAIAPFWALADHPGVRRTATVHDPPRPVAFPLRTAFVARHRVLQAAVHRVPQRLWQRIEASRLAGVSAVVLSPAGVEATRQLGLLDDVREGQLFVPDAPELPRAAGRPRAVGLFGHVYKGKGFNHLAEIRAALPPDIPIRVAGRGTEQLPPLDGVEVLGGLPDDELAGFFGSIRLLLLPYEPTSLGGISPVPASLTHLTALAHGTPVLATPTEQTRALAQAGGCLLAEDATALAHEAARLIGDPLALGEVEFEAERYLATRSDERAVAPYLELWGAR